MLHIGCVRQLVSIYVYMISVDFVTLLSPSHALWAISTFSVRHAQPGPGTGSTGQHGWRRPAQAVLSTSEPQDSRPSGGHAGPSDVLLPKSIVPSEDLKGGG